MSLFPVWRPPSASGYPFCFEMEERPVSTCREKHRKAKCAKRLRGGLGLVWAAICIKDISIFSIFHITVPAQTIRPCVCAHKKYSRKSHFYYISLPVRWESWWVKVKCGSVIERLDHEARSIFTLGLLIRIYFFGNLIKIGCFLSMVNRFFQCPMQQTCLDFDLRLDHFEMFFCERAIA